MQGSIRMAVGFVMVFGAVGGMDAATDSQLVALVLTAVVGLFLMNSGVKAMNGGL